MEARELRIGNYYHWNAEGKNYLYQIKTEDFIKGNIQNFEPIPITEEWFKKFHLTCHIQGNTIIIDSFELIWNDKFEYYRVTMQGIYLRDINYVHEWQNLYYILFENELKID